MTILARRTRRFFLLSEEPEPPPPSAPLLIEAGPVLLAESGVELLTE
jgi:hypothetical protein